MSNHWSDDRLLERLYELTEGDEHLESCPGCQQKWKALLARKTAAAQSDADPRMLAAQRRRIYMRVDEKRPASRLRWASALAGAGALAMALLVFRQDPAPPAVQTVQVSDAQLVTEVYQLIESDGPRAAMPVRALFEE